MEQDQPEGPQMIEHTDAFIRQIQENLNKMKHKLAEQESLQNTQ